MQIGYVVGMVIGAFLMLSVSGLILNMNQSSGSLSLYETAKIEHKTTMDFLKSDFRMIGYRYDDQHIIHPGEGNVDSTRIRFRYRPLDSQDELDIRWRIEEYDDERNRLIRREDGDEQVINNNLSKDSYFAYYDESGNPTQQPNQIQKIKFFMETLPRAQWGDGKLKTRTETTVVPPNLQLN